MILANGFQVEPTDGTPALAEEASRRLRVPVRVMRFHELNAASRYDAVWANASLLHVPRPGLPAILARIRRALRPGGLHFASYKAGGREGRDRFGRYFNYLDEQELLTLYGAAGWKILDSGSRTGGGYDGKPGPWAWITTQRH